MSRGFWNRLEEGIIAFLLVFMTLLVFLDVIMRFGFGTGFLWTQELTLYASAWFVLFGISYGLKVGAHIGVDAVIRLLPPGPRRVISALAVFLCICYCGFFIYGAWIYLSKIYVIGVTMDDLRFPMWFVSVLPDSLIESWQIDKEDPLILSWMLEGMMIFGFFLFSLRLFHLFYSVITGSSSGFHHVDEAEASLKLSKTITTQKPEEKEGSP